MKAVTCTDARLDVVDVLDPVPAKGQLLLKVLRCGICGSDLHARRYCDSQADMVAELGYEHMFRRTDPMVLGHEFCGEVLEDRPGGRRSGPRFPAGTRVVSFPLLRRGPAVHPIGLSPQAPGGYAEMVLAEAAMTFAVPNGLSADLAALTEPMAVGLHAVNRSQIKKGQVAVVIGCGPVGLAVILMLKARGVRTVVASDLSPGRRALALACGADLAVDPTVDTPFPAGHGHLTNAEEIFELGVGSMEKLRAVPLVPWERIYRAADRLGATTPKHPVVFECVGVPGMIDRLVTQAPLYSKVVVVGVCMQDDTIRPAMAINKEIDLRFVLGYTPIELRDALHLLAAGTVDATPVLTGLVGLGGVDAAFTALADPEKHAKILIDPSSDVTEVAGVQRRSAAVAR